MTINRIRELSKERGISLTFLCKKLGLAQVYFIDVEKNNREIPMDKLSTIARHLFTNVDYLLGKSDNKDVLSAPDKFELLNAEGQQKVIEYISDLLTNPRYMLNKTIEFKPEDTEYVNYGRAVAFGGKVEESKLTAEDERNAQAALDRLRKQKK